MSELVSNYPSRQTRLVQPCRRRLPKAVRGDPVEARAVKRRSNVATGVLRVAQTTERIGEHRLLKPHSSRPPPLQVGHSPGGENQDPSSGARLGVLADQPMTSPADQIGRASCRE